MKKIILTIYPQSCSVIIPELKSIETLKIPEKILKDQQIQDKSALRVLLTSYFQSKKIKTEQYECILLLSKQVSYVKAFDHTEKMFQLRKHINQFQSKVPVEDHFSKTFVIKDKIEVIVVSRSLYLPFIEILKSLDFTVKLMISCNYLDKYCNKKCEIDLESAKSLVYNYDNITKWDLLDTKEEKKVKSETKSDEDMSHDEEFDNLSNEKSISKQLKENRQWVLLSVFIFLVLILIVVIFTVRNNNSQSDLGNNQNISQQQPTSAIKPITPTLAITVTPTPIPTISEQELEELADLRIGITAKERTKDFSVFLLELEDMGLNNIEVEYDQTVNVNETIITVNSELDKNIIENLVRKIEDLKYNFSLKYSDDTYYDIKIVFES